jgi:NTP pyrophosphatase (non-canonical NTP hydrolase)
VTDEFSILRERLRRFADERDWNQFHSPKNLALALVGEVGELAALLQWLTADEAARISTDDTLRTRMADELADVLLYLVRLSDVVDVDLLSEAYAKIERNERRYPVDTARGTALKYTELNPARTREQGS